VVQLWPDDDRNVGLKLEGKKLLRGLLQVAFAQLKQHALGNVWVCLPGARVVKFGVQLSRVVERPFFPVELACFSPDRGYGVENHDPLSIFGVECAQQVIGPLNRRLCNISVPLHLMCLSVVNEPTHQRSVCSKSAKARRTNGCVTAHALVGCAQHLQFLVNVQLLGLCRCKHVVHRSVERNMHLLPATLVGYLGTNEIDIARIAFQVITLNASLALCTSTQTLLAWSLTGS